MNKADNDDVLTHHPNAMQTAVAIAYQTGETAPKVVAKGKGLIAEQIILRAQENGVYVHQSKELVSLLMQIDLDDRIPPNLYRAVAELLAWLYHIETELSQRTYADKPSPPTF